MGGSFSTRFHESWHTGGFWFHLLLDPISENPKSPGDAEIVDQALALNGLHFDLEDPAASVRIAGELLRISAQLRIDLAESDNSRDISFLNHVDDLDELLRAVIEGTESADHADPGG